MSQETINDSKLAILDAIGCGIAGSSDSAVHNLMRALEISQETGQVPTFGNPKRFLPRAAALINGAMIHALEMDDTHSFSSVHAGGPVLASALSASHLQAASGARFIEAVVAGYEIACRLGMAIRGKTPYHRGFHPTGICGIFGAATAAGKVFDLDAPGFLSAWGIAGSMASGLMSYLQNGAWTKKLQPGWAAQSGFLAAVLARGGYLGPDDIFQGNYNFCSAYADAFDPEPLTEELGKRFEVSRMSYKRFACCRTIHAPITAALKLRELPGFHPTRIEEIHAILADEDIPLVVEPLEKKKHPETIVDAQFSMPFGVALALIEGDAMADQYTADRLKDPHIQDLCRKFRYTLNSEYTRRRPLYFPCELRVRTAGTWHTASVDAPLGDYTNPMSREEMLRKFRRLCCPVLGDEVTPYLERSVLSLETRLQVAHLFS
jgi:2-methylcitrate dehydratase PrpD